VGEQLLVEASAPTGPITLDTFAGSVEWGRSSPLTPLGQLALHCDDVLHELMGLTNQYCEQSLGSA